MARIDKRITKILNKPVTILITGESGTGKSHLAKKIFKEATSHKKKFVEVHCTTLSNHLFESELFGHVKGAFTGAIRDKVGKVVEADGGTIFLDEIGELSLKCQSKLLRLLQDKVVTRIGSNDDIRVDTRIILATNKDLRAMVESGRFREDLYYRINMFEFVQPSLRTNPELVPELIEEFVEDFTEELGFESTPEIEPELYSRLCNYNWPGNARELKNTIHRLFCLSDGDVLRLSDLPKSIYDFKNPASIEIQNFDDKDLSIKEVEKLHIRKILKKYTNLEKASKCLGITKVTLWRKRKEYGLS